MITIGAIVISMVFCSVLITTACMLSSRHSRIVEQRERITLEVTDHLTDSPAAPRSSLGGTNLPV